MRLRRPPEERSPAELLTFGVVNLDKPPGPSSHQVSGWIRDAVADALETKADTGRRGIGVDDNSLNSDSGRDEPSNDAGAGQHEMTADEGDAAAVSETTSTEPIDRAAHAGTLDPKVTGCLPIMLGDATRLAPAFLHGGKEYVTVLECHGPVPADVESVVFEFEGPIFQKPPRKSAVSRRLRVREVYEIEILETDERRVLLRVRCESGTYVRKLCHDIGLALGTGAHMGDLRRTATDPFDDSTLVTAIDLVDALAFWVEDDDPELLYEIVEPGERVLSHLPSVTIAPSAARAVATGAPLYAPGVIEAPAVDRGSLVACYTPDGSAVCLGELVGSADAAEGVVVDLERVLV